MYEFSKPKQPLARILRFAVESVKSNEGRFVRLEKCIVTPERYRVKYYVMRRTHHNAVWGGPVMVAVVLQQCCVHIRQPR